MSPRDVLEYASVPEHPLIYVVGCLEPRVTIHDQQVRAANLVWALSETGSPGQLAIVGGGFAGLTAAIAAKRLGISAVVFEAKRKPCHIQAASPRKVHPRLYDWPLDGWDDNHALTFANWEPGRASDVVAAVVASANDHEVEIRTRHVVTDVGWTSDERRCVLHIRTDDGEETFEADGAIIAVGFGLEKHFPGYWEPDSLEAETASRFTVGGLGDGALVDVSRIRLGGADHDFFDLLEEIGRKTPAAIRQQLVALERAAEAANRRLLQSRGPGSESEPQQGPQAAVSPPAPDATAILADGLRRIAKSREALSELHDLVQQHRRSDTRVTLVGRASSPFKLTSSCLNRWLLFLLLQDDPFTHRSGTKYVEGELSGTTLKVTTRGQEVEEEVDGRVVSRFGSARPLRPSSEHAWMSRMYEALQERQVGSDAARIPQWHQGAFDRGDAPAVTGYRFFLATERGATEDELTLLAQPVEDSLVVELAVVPDTAGIGLEYDASGPSRSVEDAGCERARALLHGQEGLPSGTPIVIFEVRIRGVEPEELRGKELIEVPLAQVDMPPDVIRYETVHS